MRGGTMMMNINEVMLNPTRMRIIQELANQPTLTSTQLCQKINDVPRTTMYRYINMLLEHRLLTIVSEKKIRGSIERTLALNISEFQKRNTIENSSQNALGFLLEKYGRFHNYFNRPQPNPAQDKIFLNNTVLMLSDSEFNNFLSELRDLLIRYQYETTKERKPRDISIISAPVDDTQR